MRKVRVPLVAVVLGLLGWNARAEGPVAPGPRVVVLGTVQDGGLPQTGCTCVRCEKARHAPAGSPEARKVASLAIHFPASGRVYLIDATPDLPRQIDAVHAFREHPQGKPDRAPLDGVLLTHAHMGHYLGLAHLGFESVSTKNLPVWASPKMASFLRANGPWSQMVKMGNIALREVEPGSTFALEEGVTVKAFTVPHRDEYSDTLAFLVRGPNQTLLYVPDTDTWRTWPKPLLEVLRDEKVDVALLDGTFYSADELPDRDATKIRHPLIADSMDLLEPLVKEGKLKVVFTHLNHSNPALEEGSAARREIERRGFGVAREGEGWELGPPPPPPEVDVSFLKIPLRDGVHLGSVLYRPAGSGGPAPVILSLTPYTADSLHPLGMAFARRGYAFAATDVRGRGESGGVLEPWLNDGRDGHDAARWLARQPWSDGRVALLGHSYGGRAVWSSLKEGPEAVAAGVSIAPSLPMVSWKNIAGVDMLQWLFQSHGAALHPRLAFDDGLWRAKLRRLYLEHLPFRGLDRLVGARSETFQRMLDHPTSDEFWTSVTPRAADYARLRQPILLSVGAYDPPTAVLYYYRELEKHASEEQRRRTWLILGPWDHPGALRPQSELGGVTIGPAGVFDMPELLAGWLDASLRGRPLPPFFRKRIAYYVLGAEEWRYAETLDEISGERSILHLDSPPGLEKGSAEGARSLARAGTLAAGKPERGASDSYVYDPLDTRPGLAEEDQPADWITDDRGARTLAGNGLVYEGAPFAEELEIAGSPRLTVWISMDVPDTDFVAGLYLVGPDGGSVLLGEDFIRARYRKSLERESLVQPEAIERYDFELPFHVRRCPRGSRLRLLFRSPNSLYWQKNYNSGGVVADESGEDARTAHVTLHHDAEHPSRLELPLARGN